MCSLREISKPIRRLLNGVEVIVATHRCSSVARVPQLPHTRSGVLELPPHGGKNRRGDGMTTGHQMHEGTLSNTTFPSLVYSILRRADTGVLRVQDHGVEKSLYIRDGRPIFAGSTDPEDRLGVLYLRNGKVTLAGLLSALEKSTLQKKRLGTVLVEMALIQIGRASCRERV